MGEIISRRGVLVHPHGDVCAQDMCATSLTLTGHHKKHTKTQTVGNIKSLRDIVDKLNGQEDWSFFFRKPVD